MNGVFELQPPPPPKMSGVAATKIQHVNTNSNNSIILDHQKVTYPIDDENNDEDNYKAFYNPKDFAHPNNNNTNNNKNVINEQLIQPQLQHHQQQQQQQQHPQADENQKHHQVMTDLNNNFIRPDSSIIEVHNHQTQVFHHKHFPSHISSPLIINTQFNPPPFVNHLSMIHSPYFSSLP